MFNNKLKHELLYIIAFLGFIAFVGFDHILLENSEVSASTLATETAVESGGTQQVSVVTPTPTVKPLTEVESYILEVFGDDYNKAILLLKGNEECGGENKTLNPKAVNTYGNTPAGSRDIGIFQINEYWQDVNAKFLFDYKINIQIAHKIFRDSGNSFKMWSAGKCMGI